MKVFISWSGERSRLAAEAFGQWLPSVINAVRPFVSTGDIPKGAEWFDSIQNELKDVWLGLVCLTPENIGSNWLHWEAGALAAKGSKARVWTFLLDLEWADVKPPLSQFHNTTESRDDIYKLIQEINKQVAVANEPSLDETILAKSFSRGWDELNTQLAAARAAIPSDSSPQRDARELMAEVLGIVRSLRTDTLLPEILIRLRRLERQIVTNPDVAAVYKSLVRDSILIRDLVDEYEKELASRGSGAPGEAKRPYWTEILDKILERNKPEPEEGS